MQIRFIRFNEDVALPVRQHPADAGADIKMLCGGEIAPGQTLRILLGFGVEIPNGYCAKLQVRTSVAMHGISVEGCAIDGGYVGELSIILRNLSQETYTWKKGDRLCYLEMYPCVYPVFVENLSNTRGCGAFGSTGR